MSSANSSQNASLGRLSTAEAAELAAGLADLAKAGLPLPAGLRALAEEWPSGRLRPALLELADRVEQGVALEEAIGVLRTRLPAHLRGLITAGIRSGRLAEALEQYVDLERTQHELRRQVWLSLAYPTLLMIAMSILAILSNFYIIHQMSRIYRDFNSQLPGLTKFILEGSGPFTFLLLAVTAIMLAIPLLLFQWPGSSWLSPMLNILPIIGPMLRLGQMARFSRLMAILLEQQVPLSESLRLTADALGDAYLARACRKTAAEIEQGRSFSESIAAKRKFPADLLPLVELGEQASMLQGAFQSAAEMYEGRASTQGKNLEVLLLPGVFLVIICFYGVFVIGTMMPLISLITRLTGGK